jgi:hypothetical protein
MTQAFNLSQLANKVNTSGQLDATTGLSGATPIANGGTNNASLAVTAGGALYTDGSKVVNVGAGSSGQVLTSQGASAPIWQTAQGGFANMQVFPSSGTFTVPSGITKVKVTVVGGGGNGAASTSSGTISITSTGGGGGGGGGTAIEIISGLTPLSTVSVTVGGAAGTSSFGAFCSATGGGNASGISGGNGGAGSGGNLDIGGADGGNGNTIPSGSNGVIIRGTGGSSFLGGGGRIGNNGKQYGGGGGGGLNFNGSGTSGAAGVVVVEW